MQKADPIEMICISKQFRVTHESRSFGGKCFPTLVAPISACNRSVHTDPHMSKFTGDTTFPAIDLPVKHDACADTIFNKHQNKVPDITNFRAPKPELCQSRGIGIIISNHRKAGCGLDLLHDPWPAPLKMGNI